MDLRRAAVIIFEIKDAVRRALNVLYPDWKFDGVKVTEIVMKSWKYGWDMHATIFAEGVKGGRKKIARIVIGNKISVSLLDSEYLYEYYRTAADAGFYLLELIEAGKNRDFRKLIIKQMWGGVVDCEFA